MNTWHVLTLDADTQSHRDTGSYLVARGYRVTAAGGLGDLHRRLERTGADVVVLDLRACGADPLDELRRLRQQTAAALIVTDSAGDVLDRILALELGADDVLALPLQPRELLARIRGFQRRVAAARRHEGGLGYSFAGWRFLPAQHRLIGPDRDEQRLTRGECALLRALAAAPGKLLSRSRLLSAVHADAEQATARSIDVVVARLRRKLGAARRVIAAERGLGYRLDCEVAAERVS
jgi:two-component system OmpR family response regulator